MLSKSRTNPLRLHVRQVILKEIDLQRCLVIFLAFVVRPIVLNEMIAHCSIGDYFSVRSEHVGRGCAK
jgi:hypothetical protein